MPVCRKKTEPSTLRPDIVAPGSSLPASLATSLTIWP